MKNYLIIVAFVISNTNTFGQTTADSVQNLLWAKKQVSIFKKVKSGVFSGTTSGYLQIKNEKDTLILDFKNTSVSLVISPDIEEIYDISTKRYATKTTNGKTNLIYETYALANILTIKLNGSRYSIGSMDGAADNAIQGLSFSYCHEGNIEYLSLYASKSLQLSTTDEIMRLQKINYTEAKKLAKQITVLSGSCFIFTISK